MSLVHVVIWVLAFFEKMYNPFSRVFLGLSGVFGRFFYVVVIWVLPFFESMYNPFEVGRVVGSASAVYRHPSPLHYTSVGGCRR